MKSDSSILNFILGVILLLLLAIAARAQTKSNTPPVKENTATVKKKKAISAEEAKVLYEEKNGTAGDKRKSYSRKDIEESIPEENTVTTKPAEEINYKVKQSNTTTDSTISRVPKAIYKGAINKEPMPEDSFFLYKPKPAVIKFIEHIEIEIGNGN